MTTQELRALCATAMKSGALAEYVGLEDVSREGRIAEACMLLSGLMTTLEAWHLRPDDEALALDEEYLHVRAELAKLSAP